MKILVVGGSGFVSGTLARCATASGHKVWAVTRGRRPLPDGVRPLIADRHDGTAFRDAILGTRETFDLCVDCIAYRAEDVRQDLAVLPPVTGHFVLISTDFVYDPVHRLFPQPADARRYLRDESYGAHKRRCEETLLAADTGSMRWTVLRPCHIYGPGSLLGCLPQHGRDPDLIARLRRGEPLRLVGAGRFLQQPLFAEDLAAVALGCASAREAHGRILNTAGPEWVESVQYYRIVAELLGTDLRVEEIPVTTYLAAHPEHASFLCHRIYDLSPLAAAGLPVPATPLAEGLRRHLQSLETTP